jgi:murein DD-endopeptidase MepM/ murein hydrolase activator NlpD
MATSTVEILSSQLGNGVISNAASDAALKELLQAIQGMSSNSNSAMGANSPVNKASKQVTGAADAVATVLKGVKNQLGNVIGATGKFAGMIMSGETKLSAYGNMLNTEVIGKLPIFGEILGALGTLVFSTVGVLEQWNDTLTSSSKYGASFGNSIIRMRAAANKAYMGLDDFINIVNSNAEAMASIGGTVTLGAERFSRWANSLLKEGSIARDTLMQMGYSTSDVGNAFARFIAVTQRGSRAEIDVNGRVAKSFIAYELQYDKLLKLTGKNSDELAQATAGASQDVAFNLKLNTLGDQERAKVVAGLNTYTAMWGPLGADLYKAQFLGMKPLKYGTQMMSASLPIMTETVKELLAQAQDKKITTEQFTANSDEVMIKSTIGAAKGVKRIEPLIDAAFSGAEGLEDLKDTEWLLKYLSQFGDYSKLNADAIRQRYKEIEKEQKAREAITKLLNGFDMAVLEFKTAVMDVLLKEFEGLSDAVRDRALGEKFREMGRQFGLFVSEALPQIMRFFSYFSTDEGRVYLMAQADMMMDIASVYFRNAVRKVLPHNMFLEMFGVNTINTEADIKKIRDRYAEQLAIYKRAADESVKQSDTTKQGPVPSSPAEQEKQRINREQNPSKSGGGAYSTLQMINPLRAFKGRYRTAGRVGEDRGDHIHEGLDLAIKGEDSIPIESAFEGQVITATEDKVAGLFMEIYNKDHDLTARYLHLDPSSVGLMKSLLGTNVKLGDIIGYVGNTGRSSGRHLHYELRKGRGFRKTQVLNPQEIQRGEFSKGTLGTTVGEYAKMKKATPVKLHGNEAILSPNQMASVLNSSSQISLQDFIYSLNSNMSSLIRSANDDLRIEKMRLSVAKRS